MQLFAYELSAVIFSKFIHLCKTVQYMQLNV